MSDYDDPHRLFLQAMMSRAIISTKEARLVLAHICQLQGLAGKVGKQNVETMVQQVNAKIRDFSMEIKHTRCEETGGEFYALVNTLDGSGTIEKMSHIYSIQEREIFRRILEMIVESETYGAVSSTDILNMPNCNLRPGEIEALLERLKNDQWFALRTGKIVPAPRCIAEFETYFKNNYRDHVSICPVCDVVAFQGVFCTSCSTITHRHCFAHVNKNNCPSCRAVINARPVQESQNSSDEDLPPKQHKKSRAASSSQSLNSSLQNTPCATKPKRRRD